MNATPAIERKTMFESHTQVSANFFNRKINSMKVKLSFTILVLILATIQGINAQTGSWSLSGNNLTGTEKLGSKNKFSLQFITNNAERMRIDASGGVGIGNKSPTKAGLVVDKAAGNTNAIFGSNTAGISIVSNNPSLYFNSYYNNCGINLANGFSGALGFNTSDGSFGFYSTPAAVAAGGIASGVNRMIITNNGSVGIGTTTPAARLDLGDAVGNTGLLVVKSIPLDGSDDVTNAVDARITDVFALGSAISASNDGWGDAIIGSSAKGEGLYVEIGNTTHYAGFFNGPVFSTGDFHTSDERLKQNIRDFSSALSIINQLHPKLYQYKKEGDYALMRLPEGDHYGLIAQDVEKVLPNLVKETAFNTRKAKYYTGHKPSSSADTVEIKALNYTELIPILIKAVQEQEATIQELKQLVNKLQTSSSTSANIKVVSIGSPVLEQNEPNPFTNTTSIHYTLPAGVSKAQLVITDSKGGILKQMTLNSSTSSVVNIEASTLSAGTYFYSIIVDGKKIDSKKMIIER